MKVVLKLNAKPKLGLKLRDLNSLSFDASCRQAVESSENGFNGMFMTLWVA